jgi:hypothetical protein
LAASAMTKSLSALWMRVTELVARLTSPADSDPDR